MSVSNEDLVAAYIGIRTQIKEASDKLKSYKEKLEVNQAVIISYFKREADRTGLNSFPTDAGTAFTATDEWINISDKMAFIEFILNQMLLTVYASRYREDDGEWRDHGPEMLKRDRNAIIDAEILDFFNISPNKNNCLQYMEEHDKVLPKGLKYTSEKTIQFRKPSGRKKK